MRRRRFAGMGLLALAVAGAVACSEPTGGSGDGEGTIVSFAFQGYPRDTLRVEVRDPETVRAAEAYLRTGQGAHIPIGPIVRGAGVDPRYPFHFLPDSVRLAEVAVEVCDGAPMRTAAEVDAFIGGATGSRGSARARYCPWGAYPVAVR